MKPPRREMTPPYACDRTARASAAPIDRAVRPTALRRHAREDVSLVLCAGHGLRPAAIVLATGGDRPCRMLQVSATSAESLFPNVDAVYEERSIAFTSKNHRPGFDELRPKALEGPRLRSRPLNGGDVELNAQGSFWAKKLSLNEQKPGVPGAVGLFLPETFPVPTSPGGIENV
jgi:hypothetical protein